MSLGTDRTTRCDVSRSSQPHRPPTSAPCVQAQPHMDEHQPLCVSTHALSKQEEKVPASSTHQRRSAAHAGAQQQTQQFELPPTENRLGEGEKPSTAAHCALQPTRRRDAMTGRRTARALNVRGELPQTSPHSLSAPGRRLETRHHSCNLCPTSPRVTSVSRGDLLPRRGQLKSTFPPTGNRLGEKWKAASSVQTCSL